jgi:cytochrome c-type biogenesis protein CcmF
MNRAGNIIYFKVNFKSKENGKSFDLYPNLIKNTKGQENYSNNPDKYHYWDRDIFTYLNYANVMDKDRDTTQFQSHILSIHDTIFYSKGYMILDSIVVNPDNDKFHFKSTDTALMADLRVVSRDSMQYKARPLLSVKNNQAVFVADTVFAQNLAVLLRKVADHNKVEILTKESSAMIPFVSLKVYEFPHINLLWLGILLMIFGFIMSILRRKKQNLRISH